MDLIGVPVQYLDVVWNDVKDRISETLERFSDDELTAEDVHQQIMNRDAQLWTTTAKDSVCVTKLIKRKNHTELLLWLVHANQATQEHWDFIEQIKEWAKSQGCTKARSISRPGFEKPMIRAGWKRRYITLVQEL
jgi:hypothetical protein